MIRISALLTAALALSSVGPVRADDSAYIEFLWSPAPRGALARAEAFGFVMGAGQDHRICVVADAPITQSSVLRIDVKDASGHLVSSQRHDDFKGNKECYPVDLDASGAPGEWAFGVHVNDKLLATKTLEVARTLEEARFHADPSRPYALGRPNYNASIPAAEYIGKVSWIMSVDEAGAVSHVELENAVGAGKRMEDRAVAAGYITRFPPDPSRAVKPYKVRQEYTLGTD